MPAWQDLKRTARPASTEPTDFDLACVQALGGPAGHTLMRMLRERYVEHVLPGVPEERALLAHHAKRQVVRELEDAILRGTEQLKAAKK